MPRTFTAQINAELPFFLRRQGRLLATFNGKPTPGSIFYRRRLQKEGEEGGEEEEEDQFLEFQNQHNNRHVKSDRKLLKRFTDTAIHQFVEKKVQEELAAERRHRLHKQRRSLDSFDENSNNNIDSKRAQPFVINKLEGVAEKSKKHKKPLPKSSSSIAFTFTQSAISSNKRPPQVPNLAQNSVKSRIRSQSTSSDATKQAQLRKTLSPVPERRRKLRQSYSTTQRKPQYQQNYTSSTTSSTLKRFVL